MSSTCVVWFRRDLRVSDHPALCAAVERADRVVGVFCVDDRLLRSRRASGPRTQFMLECLADVDRSLRERGSGLVIRRGRPEREIPDLAGAVGAGEIHFTQDATPYARARDRRVAAACEASGIRVIGHPGLWAVDDPAGLVTGAGTAYQVFRPFHRRWLAEPRRSVRAAPASLGGWDGGLDTGRIPSLGELGLEQCVGQPIPGGERAAWRRLDEFRTGGVAGYASGGHDGLAEEGTSRLSAYLRFGCISPRQIEAGLDGGEGAEAFRRQLCWRDFYLDLLRRHPENAGLEQQVERRGIAWRDAPEDLERWKEGLTGYPLVDAGMRQLRAEGFMHNRTRMVVGSFLTKHLGIDWREGERWFMGLLLDGDPAVNNGNWQWIASVGSDPQPVGRRLLSPTRQQERFDPDGVYVRRWVRELRGVPNAHLAEPWRMPHDLALECRCVVGRDYPWPIVDHASARREALARYAAAGG
ncbi:MAG TPA: deoxyribodipyrimidine photo-lyase [Solirubrobacteraceae bacterium]